MALFGFGAEIAELRVNRGTYESGVPLGVKGIGLLGMMAVIGNAVISSPASLCSVCRSACRIRFDRRLRFLLATVHRAVFRKGRAAMPWKSPPSPET